MLVDVNGLDAKTAAFIEDLVEQLADIYQRTLNLFREVQLKSYYQTQGGTQIKMTILDPTPKEQVHSATLHRQYQGWSRVIQAFLSREPKSAQSEFAALIDVFASYILLRRSGANLTDEVWRELFVRESAALFNAQVEVIYASSHAFSLFKSRKSIRYTDFVLEFSRSRSGIIRLGRSAKDYKVSVKCELGEAESSFVLPFDDRELETLLLKYCQPRQAATRGWEPKAVRPLSEFGHKLFASVMSGKTLDLFSRTRQAAEVDGCGVRIRIRLKNTPEFGDVPWEFMYDGKDFLCLSNHMSITRYLDSIISSRKLMVTPPFRLLSTTSSPKGWQPLDVVKEQEQLEAALAPLVALGLLKIDFSADGTLRTLQRMLRTADAAGNPYHIWHFVGHGVYDTEEKASVLVFEDEQKLGHAVSGFELGTLFNNYPSVRLAVLNACEGARTSREEVLSGVATALLDRELPAVIAMQFEISDTAAIAFVEEFYAALVDGLPIDTALSDARRYIFFLPNYVEWANPVLFLRAQDGTVFDVHSAL